MPTLTLTEDEIRQAISTAEAVDTVEAAFATMAKRLAYLPDAINLNLPSVEGESHIKGAYSTDTPYFVVKVANRFYSNPSVGLPVGSGVVLAFDAATGFLAAILLDNGFLTDLRTGAAGAVAVRHLAPATIRQVAFIGAGTQARFQFRAIATVRDIPSVIAWSRNPANADRFVGEIVDDAGCAVHVAETVEEAVSSSDLVITATPSRHALVLADWVRPGTTLIAVGSDTPDKQELDPNLLARADMVITDSLSQCTKIGEIHHALTAGLLSLDGVTGELGEVVTGRIHGRTADDQIIVCDLSGVAVLDASLTTLVMEKAYFMGLGQRKRGRMEGYDLL
jgi:ornithine cyclodeaminase/alanine dehydrogenase-like protein (mu-crystallin family)